MIQISDVETFGFRKAIFSMRNPYMSHAKSDSKLCGDINCDNCYMTSEQCNKIQSDDIVIGEADMALCKKLIRAGSEHRKFLRMIHVQADVVAPRYWWAEMDKYKYVEANSSSTMHLITKRELRLDDFSANKPTMNFIEHHLLPIINPMICEYRQTKDEELFLTIKQILLESYNQLRTIDTNYECLLNIYHQRHAHRLPEWREFCDWCLRLPYMEEFINA